MDEDEEKDLEIAQIINAFKTRIYGSFETEIFYKEKIYEWTKEEKKDFNINVFYPKDGKEELSPVFTMLYESEKPDYYYYDSKYGFGVIYSKVRWNSVETLSDYVETYKENMCVPIDSVFYDDLEPNGNTNNTYECLKFKLYEEGLRYFTELDFLLIGEELYIIGVSGLFKDNESVLLLAKRIRNAYQNSK